MTNTGEFTQFRFDRASLATPRPPGISAIMRIKNGADYLRLSIESHLPYVDEIVACYNDCTDDTEKILNELASQHPTKVRLIEYSPRVHPILSAEHAATPSESVHSIANYYNFALSQARFSYATKLDDDHLAIDATLGQAITCVREAVRQQRHELFTFSGLNLARDPRGQLGVYAPQPFVGTGDHLFFPVCDQVYFVQDPRTEVFQFDPPRLPKRYVGLLYFHLKHCKPGAGFHNLDKPALAQAETQFGKDFEWMSFEAFSEPRHLQKLRSKINSLEYWLRTRPAVDATVQALTGRRAPLKIARMARLESDLAAIQFARDAIQRVPLLN